MGWTYTALTEKSEAKLIEITTDDGSLVFVNGTSSSSKTLSVVAEGFTPVSYKWEKKNGDNWTTISGATDSSYTITGVENVGTYRATAYEDANTGYYDIITIASVSDGQGGSSPYLFSLSNENFTINTTNDLKPTTSLNYEVKVTGYHGSSVMTSIASGTPTAEQFKITIPSGSIFSLKSGTTDTLVYAANTSTALSSENLAETITITYDTNKTETKTITVSCAKNGISPTVTQGTGSVTITDASGHAGTVNDGHSPSVTATKSNGVTSVKVDGTQVATISDGATGKNALQPNRNWSGTFTTINQTTTCGTDDFNRTPVVGDTFTNLDGSSNTGTWQVTAISGTTVTIKLLSYVNSKGAKGDTGAKGADASQIKDNLLLNSNFGKGNLTSWATWGPSTNSYNTDSTYKHCAKLELGTTTWKGIQQTIVRAKANCTYTVSAMFFTYTANKNAAIGVHCRSDNAIMTQAWESKLIQTNNWYQLTLTFTTPANTTNLLLMFGNDQDSQTNFTIWVTNCKLEENSVATAWVPNTSEFKGDKGDPGTSITGPRGAYYRGTATSAPSSPVNGDYYFNTSTGYIQTYNGSSWIDDTMAVTNFHVLDAINDIISWCASNTSHSMYDTNKGLTDSYVDKLLVGTALINKLFARQITLQTGGVIQSSDYSTTAGFKINANGTAEFNGNSLSVNSMRFKTTGNSVVIGTNSTGGSLGSDDVSNVFIGDAAGVETGQSSTGSTGNVFIGCKTGEIAQGNHNVYIGTNAGKNNFGDRNVFINAGEFATAVNNSIYIVNDSSLTDYYAKTGSYNIMMVCNHPSPPNIFISGENNVLIGCYGYGDPVSLTGNCVNINNVITYSPSHGVHVGGPSTASGGRVLTTGDILYSRTSVNSIVSSLLNVSEIYLRAMAVDSASGTTSQAYSKACSSYITFSNGLKIQWGVIKAGATRKNMYFPISFSGNNTYALFLTNREPNNSGTDTGGWDYTTSINSKTASTANISIPNSNNPFEWIAIGY